MKIVHEFPPNISDIERFFGSIVRTDPYIIFTYGSILYNPHKITVEDHMLVHEQVHEIQQKEIGVIEWWNKYLSDVQFRLNQELEAYSVQYKYFRSKYKTKISDLLLDNISKNLSSSMYGNMLSFHKARTMIRKWTK